MTNLTDNLSPDVVLETARPHLSADAMANLSLWMTGEQYTIFRPAIAEMIASGSWEDIENSFYTVLPFGTGGRRGPRGIGPNRINARTMAESARGLADWVVSRRFSDQPAVAIACDTRHASPELARVCAEVLAAAGVRALIYAEHRPTPQLSFTVRNRGLQAGIVVSASHNPPSDNGFKAYGPDGGQLVPPEDSEVMRAVEAAAEGLIPFAPFEEGVRDGRISFLGPDDDRAYRAAVLARSTMSSRSAHVVYTPLHGAGMVSVPPVLDAAGFRNVRIVDSQAYPDGDFPNVPNNIPNPEEPAALAEAARLAQECDADIAIGTDPDADRLGCAARRPSSGTPQWDALNGNQIAAILCDHLLADLAKAGRLDRRGLVLTTTVTSRLVGRIARSYGVGVVEDLLVGFKYIACVADGLDDCERLAFACEESHGYLTGPYTRDKDAAGAALLIASAASHMRDQGRTLWEALEALYDRHGFHCDLMHAHISPGRTGQQHIQRMVARLRAVPPDVLGGLPVLRVIDRLANTVTDVQTGSVSPLDPVTDPATGSVFRRLLPARDNLLVFELGSGGSVEGARAAVRPSGTEPKCKFYSSAWAQAGHGRSTCGAEIENAADAIRNELLHMALAPE